MNVHSLKSKYHSIELLRFLAAIIVVCSHIPTMINIGYVGVDIFFVISGFVMMLSTEKSVDKFFLKRIIRIVPTYYLLTLGVFSVALVMPNLLNNTTANTTHLVKSLLFIPFDKNGIGHYPILFVGWTLNFEMYFYLMFALALKVSKKYRAELTTILISMIYLATQNCSSLPLTAYASSLVFEFILGMMTFTILIKKDAFKTIFLLFMLLVSLVYTNNLGDFYKMRLGSAVFVMMSVYFLRNRPLAKCTATLGGYSYALYLTHPYVIQFLDKILHLFSQEHAYQIFGTLLGIALANLVALLIYKYMEIPATTSLRKRFISCHQNTHSTTINKVDPIEI